MSTATKPVVRAIDVGYGSTKFTVLRQGPGEVHCGLFPSIAPQASAITVDLGRETGQPRNTITVDVNGVLYEVGKDALLARDASYGRTLDSRFAETDAYIALVRGAIHYMGAEHIDVLVVGLPVNTYEAKRALLEERLTGDHVIPQPGKHKAGDGNRRDRIVRVERVRVLPQPIGALFDYSLQGGSDRYQKMRDEMNLVIDPGYYTLDWVVSKGMKIVGARSGAHSGGMSSILSVIGEAMSHDLGEQLQDYSAIDEALRLGRRPRIFGKERDLAKYLPSAHEKVRQFVAVLANKVGSAADIDNIILAGGGAGFFKDLVADKFPHHTVNVTPEPVFANTRGFQFAGEQWAAHNLQKAAA